MLYAAIQTVLSFFDVPPERRERSIDVKDVTAEQFRKVYAAILAYYTYLFTYHTRTDDIAEGSREFLDLITRERPTVVRVTVQLESIGERDGKPDLMRMSWAVARIIEDISAWKATCRGLYHSP